MTSAALAFTAATGWHLVPSPELDATVTHIHDTPPRSLRRTLTCH